jgi:hypothetical protein
MSMPRTGLVSLAQRVPIEQIDPGYPASSQIGPDAGAFTDRSPLGCVVGFAWMWMRVGHTQGVRHSETGRPRSWRILSVRMAEGLT